jgi:diguanylate cyclase (GGDEF)-like protein
MLNDTVFLQSILDTIPDHIVVINKVGDIIFTNKSWQSFGMQNNGHAADSWQQYNYLDECNKAALQGDQFGISAIKGIDAVISHKQADFYLEYPCHSDDELRWFMMRVVPFQHAQLEYYVISHKNITERKQAEENAKQLANIDGLTQIANRRYFDSALSNEWNRCRRLGMPLSIAMIDVDNFKLLNDTYGHQQGDVCLQHIAGLLKQYSKRPSDLCARFGGEEFVLMYGNTCAAQATANVEQIFARLKQLNIENKHSLPSKTLTVSVGICTLIPSDNNCAEELLIEADKLLYKAKKAGKNSMRVTDLTQK